MTASSFTDHVQATRLATYTHWLPEAVKIWQRQPKSIYDAHKPTLRNTCLMVTAFNAFIEALATVDGVVGLSLHELYGVQVKVVIDCPDTNSLFVSFALNGDAVVVGMFTMGEKRIYRRGAIFHKARTITEYFPEHRVKAKIKGLLHSRVALMRARKA
jgi:hypothetical protein